MLQGSLQALLGALRQAQLPALRQLRRESPVSQQEPVWSALRPLGWRAPLPQRVRAFQARPGPASLPQEPV